MDPNHDEDASRDQVRDKQSQIDIEHSLRSTRKTADKRNDSDCAAHHQCCDSGLRCCSGEENSAQQRHQHTGHIGIVEDNDGVQNPFGPKREQYSGKHHGYHDGPGNVFCMFQLIQLLGGMEYLVVEISGKATRQGQEQAVGAGHYRRQERRHHEAGNQGMQHGLDDMGQNTPI